MPVCAWQGRNRRDKMCAVFCHLGITGTNQFHRKGQIVQRNLEPSEPVANANALQTKPEFSEVVEIKFKTANPVPHFAEKLVWLGMLAISIYFTLNIFVRQETVRFGEMSTILLLLMPLAIACVTSVFVRLIPKPGLSLSSSSLSFSPAWAIALNNRLERNWSDIHVIDAHSVSGAQFITFEFKSGGSAELNLSHLSKEETEKLLRTIENRGNPTSFSTSFVNLERITLMNQREQVSYTELWMEDLNRSYSATNFLPLKSNFELQKGRYKVGVELAAGGMSAVYLGYTEKNAKVVIKETVVPPNTDSLKKNKCRELFQREARLLASIDHPKICKVLDCFVEDERDYIVLELIPGLSLRQLVNKGGAQNESTVLNWCIQICDILDYLHSHTPPIIHRDISPENLILSEKGDIVLVDFGAANILASEATGTMIGKQCYMAPEQIRGKAICQSDLYSLGATIYFLLTAKDPLPLSQSKVDTAGKSITPELQTLVERLTALDAAKRPASAAEVCADLRNRSLTKENQTLADTTSGD